MPSVWRGRDLISIITDLARRVKALETQQQGVWSNGNGVPVVVCGRIPGSNPSSYGYQFLDPTSHVPIMFFGEDGTNGTGVLFYDASGNLVRKQDNSGDTWYNTSGYVIRKDDPTGTYWYDGTSAQHLVVSMTTTGLHVYNSSGTEEVAAGLLHSSPVIYGLGVLPYGGSSLQQVGGFISVQASNALSVTAASWTNFAGTSSISAVIGPSGMAQISVTCYIGTSGSGEVGRVGVNIDGGATTDIWLQLSESAGAGGVSGAIGSSFVVTGLTAGTHTFQLQYETANDGSNTVTFEAPNLIVQPL